MAAKEFPLAVVIRAIDKVSGPIRRIQNGLSAFDKGITRGFSRLKNWSGIEDSIDQAKRLGGALGDIRDRMMSLIGAGSAFAAIGVAAIYKVTMSYVDAASKVNDVSTALGISAERLQEVRYAGQQNGVEFEEMDRNLGILSRNLGKAMRGKGPADLLKSLGLRKADMKSADTALPKIADGIMRIRNPSLRAAAAAELFGKSGAKMLTVFAGDDKIGQGSKALQFYADELRKVNGVISNDSIAAADAFGDKMDRLKTAIFGVRNVAGETLLPVISEQIDRLSAYISEHGPQIRQWFQEFGDKLPGYIETARKAFNDLRKEIQPVIDVVTVLTSTFGGPKVLLAVVAGVITATFVPALVSATAAMWALNVALWSNPIGLVVLAVLAIIAVLAYFALKVEDGKIVLTDFGKTLLWIVTTPGYMIGSFLQKCQQGMVRLGEIVDDIKLAFSAFWDYLKGKFEEAVGWISNFADKLTGMIPDWAKGMLGGGTVTLNNSSPASGASLARSLAQPQNGEVRVKVDLNNLPPGSRVSTQQNGSPQFELNQGYAFGGM